MTDIVIVNLSTVLTDKEVAAVLPAVQAQVTEDWEPLWPGRGATIHFATAKDAIPDGHWQLKIYDTTDVPGAGGYHDDTDPAGLPEGKVFAQDAMDYGEAWTIDLTHELLEMLGDPTTDILVPLPHHMHCLQEVCDAVESDRYAYTKMGVVVTDFCLPAYFKRGGNRYDFMHRLHAPAPALLPGGYLGIELPDGQWTQVVRNDVNGLMSRRARNTHRIRRDPRH